VKCCDVSPLSLARRVRPIQGGLVRPHSKGQSSRPSNPTIGERPRVPARHFPSLSEEGKWPPTKNVHSPHSCFRGNDGDSTRILSSRVCPVAMRATHQSKIINSPRIILNAGIPTLPSALAFKV